ncbi:serine/threonine protein phosphatase [Pseudonocardia sp. EC080625-04]|uniref:PP2C family protein-serine/threonine phosphatase n=1 Tax=Pseudonocardia sp. EC080625-04 TaxID=1096868 RepID=UPI0006CB31C5|nr:SpoIIE family protein phosphatase [Pseudonocardia sp. EC080625-04]ALE75194.1 serine/threonine protein phosphatase [Pseudonocardia sp. EC080625-04]
MTETGPTVGEPTTTVDARWADAPCAAVTVGADGIVLEANDAAYGVLPQVRTGEPLDRVVPWLATAHAATSEQTGTPSAFSDVIEGRAVEAQPVRHDDGSVTWWLIDVTDVRSIRDELQLEQARAAFLSEASAALLGSLNLSRCMEVTAELAAGRLADGALVITPATRGQFQVVSATSGDTGTPRSALLRFDPDEVPGLAEALRGFPPVPSRWIDPATAPAWVAPDGLGEVGSIVVTPLPGHGIPAGALVLLRRAGSGPFSEGEEVTAREFAARAGLAMSAARMFAQQASITETLMRELLPPTLQHVSGVDFAGGYRPSQDHERVGGDFYDVHAAAEESGETLAVLGDVCGKGLEAAVLTGKIRSAVHALRPMSGDHLRLLRLLNDALLSDDHARFVTLVLASVTRRGSDVDVRLTCAGHPPPLIIRADGRVEEAATLGTLVGALPTVEATTYETRLAPGETCLLYTDGITEAQGGPLGRDQFGEDRLQRVAAECTGLPAEAVVERVQMLASEWVGRNTHDDMALLAITAPRGSHLTAVGGHGRGRYTA